MYVPVQKNSISITITLVLQLYSAEEDTINLLYFSLPLSLKSSDPMKVLDMRLRDQLCLQQDSFQDSNVDFPSFLKASRIVYVLRKQVKNSFEVPLVTCYD